MKIIAQNYAATLLGDALRSDTDSQVALDAIGCDLRSLYGEAANELPEHLLALAHRIDGARAPAAIAA